MNQEVRNTHINAKIKKAKDDLDTSLLLFENGKYHVTISRLYYACFYMVEALLLKIDKVSKSHTGTKSLFFQHYIKTNIFSEKISETYTELFNLRQKSDYDDFVEFSKEEIEPLLRDTENFIETLEKELLK